MDDLMGEFVAETRETLEILTGELVAWEADPGDRERLDAIFRFVHTVKGSCGFLDLPRLERLSHAAEDALAQVREGTRQADRGLVDAVLAVIDRIAALTEALDTGASLAGEDEDQLIAALSATAAKAPSGAVAAAGAVAAMRAPTRSIRVPLELLDSLMNGVSDLVLARNELARRLREGDHGNGLDGAFDRLSGCVAEMRDAITRTRMQRIERLFSTLPRIVRDVSAEIGKLAEIEVDGSDVELDREMIEMIRDPLTHIIRNALDHGIEAPEERHARGKPPAGRLSVTARQSGNQIVIECADDGRGIDVERLVEKAVSADIIDRTRARDLTERQALNLVFEPGLSTARAVTAVSGRGVGMDVVRANVEAIGGSIALDNRPGRGLRIIVKVPLTLTIITALTVGAGGRRYAIPRAAIDEIVAARAGGTMVETIGGADSVVLRGDRLAVVDLADALGVMRCEAGDSKLVIVSPQGGERYALAVSDVFDHEELVIRPAPPVVIATGAFAGMTLPDSGTPMLLLDLAGVATLAGLDQRPAATFATVEDVAPVNDMDGMVGALLFDDLAGRRRAIRTSLIERIEDVARDDFHLSSGRVTVVLDARIIPVAGWCQQPDDELVTLLRITDGTSEVAYAVGAVHDMVRMPVVAEPVPNAGEVGGAVLIDGRPVEVIDPHWLFSEHALHPETREARPHCLVLDADDRWARDILAPLVEQAGYRAIFADSPDAAQATLVIAGDEGPAGAIKPGTNIVKLRAGERDPGDGSIHRYDRAALAAALRNVSRASA